MRILTGAFEKSQRAGKAPSRSLRLGVSLFVLGASLAGAGAWSLLRQRDGATRASALAAELRYRDVSGVEVQRHAPSLAPDSSPADLLLDVSLPAPAASDRAALFVFDRNGRSLRAPAVLERSGGALRVLFSLRTLVTARDGVRGLLFVGRAAPLEPLLAAATQAGTSTEARIRAIAEGTELRRLELAIEPPGTRRDVPLAWLEGLERRLAAGEFAAVLAAADAIHAGLSDGEATRAAALAAEAAFGLGRTALARRLAETALAAAPTASASLLARLRRVQILAIAEGSESTEPPPERELLRATPAERPDALEAARDAGVDLRLALLHDRFAQAPPRGERAALAFLDRALALAAEPALAELAPWLCRAGEQAARADAPRAERALQLGSDLARGAGNRAAQAYCRIAAGDRAHALERWGEAENAFSEALALLGDRALPREQREAWFSAAYLAARRSDFRTAFDAAKRAAGWVNRLLALEIDIAAREALLVNTLGYYGAAARFGAASGQPREAVAVAESGKGRALEALFQGSTEVDGAAIWPIGGRAPAPGEDPFAAAGDRLRAVAMKLGARDAALSYTLLGMNAERRFELAIGVVTRERVTLTIVPQPESFRADIVALAEAVESNREDAAKAVGKRLYDALIAPVADRLHAVDRVLVSPHLRLHTLPWHALHDGRDFLLRRFAFARVPPLVLLQPSEESAPQRWLFALNPRHHGLESLPGFEALAGELVGRFPDARVVHSEAATAERIGAELARADALLFAGHASYDAVNPLRSALLTASAAAGSDARPWRDDRLEARTLLSLGARLELVVLLGCETARLWRQRSHYGDEAIGLPRAFLVAGARRVVGALWPVLDRDAEDFMRALARAEPRTDAIRQVQRAQQCLAYGPCASRGIVAWGSFVVDAR